MSSSEQQGEVNSQDSEFSVDLKTNKIKKRTKKKKQKKTTPKIITSTYKKQKCLHYNKGNCTKGQTCTFSHDFEPQSLKIICKYFLSNACSKGPNCSFSHNTQNYPCKFFHLENKCKMGNECRFSHSEVNKEYLADFVKQNKDAILGLWKEQKIGQILDQNLRKQIINFANKELALTQEDHTKRKGFKGQLKLLAQNNIELAQQKPKPIDPRLKMKTMKPTKVQEAHPFQTRKIVRSWLTQIPSLSLRQSKLSQRIIDAALIQKFLYSYY